MTPKQQKYAENRAAGLPMKEAGLAAGYAAGGIDQAVSTLEKRADIQQAITRFRDAAAVQPKRGKSKQARTFDDYKAGLVQEGEENDEYLRASYDSPLDMFLHLMNEPKAPRGIRIQAAKDALPYVHGKIESDKTGKKGQKDRDAKETATTGSFVPRRGPSANRKHVN